MEEAVPGHLRSNASTSKNPLDRGRGDRDLRLPAPPLCLDGPAHCPLARRSRRRTIQEMMSRALRLQALRRARSLRDRPEELQGGWRRCRGLPARARLDGKFRDLEPAAGRTRGAHDEHRRPPRRRSLPRRGSGGACRFRSRPPRASQQPGHDLRRQQPRGGPSPPTTPTNCAPGWSRSRRTSSRSTQPRRLPEKYGLGTILKADPDHIVVAPEKSIAEVPGRSPIMNFTSTKSRLLPGRMGGQALQVRLRPALREAAEGRARHDPVYSSRRRSSSPTWRRRGSSTGAPPSSGLIPMLKQQAYRNGSRAPGRSWSAVQPSRAGLDGRS